jgi:O-antigen/teichoic acid export membrane protein
MTTEQQDEGQRERSPKWLAWKNPSDLSRTKNVLWNLPASALQVLLPFAFIPLYIKLIGAEAYGLLVLNASILSSLLFLDRLFSLVIVREFGRRNGDEAQAGTMGRMLRTFEGVALAISIVVTAGIILVLPMVAAGWQGMAGLSPNDLQKAFLLMALAVGAQWPGFLYGSALAGLQRQALLSGVKVATAIVQHGGGWIILTLVDNSVLALLAWQCGVFLGSALLSRLLVWRTMPQSVEKPRVSMAILREVRAVALGSLMIGLASSLITQLDKLLVAREAPPIEFTAYGLSFMAASALFSVLTGPMGTAMQPHFARLIDTSDESALAETYHRWTQVLALLAVPVAGALIAFPGVLVDIWLGVGTPIGALVVGFLPIIVFGLLLGVLLTPPALMQVAAGWNTLMLACHAFNIVLMVTLLPLLLRSYGSIAGAWFSVGIAAIYYLVMIPLMHRRLLRGSLWRWALRDVALPSVAGLAVVSGVALALPPLSIGRAGQFVEAVAATCLAFAVLLALLPDGRRQLIDSARFLVGGRFSRKL